MTFDQYGYLTPYTVIETDLQTFEQTFVTAFTGSTTRPKIFMAYLGYLDQLRQIVGDGGFYQWIDGSFVTKKQNPDDIDFVTFVDAKVFEKHQKELENLTKFRYIKGQLLDSYFVATYNDIRFASDRLYWLDKFGKDDRKRFKNKKGFLQLTF